MKKRGVLLLLLFTLAASMGFSQNSGGASNGSNSTAGAGASAAINQTTTYPNGFVQAIPGAMAETFPGVAPESPGCYIYRLDGLPPLTDPVINSIARGGKIPRGYHVTSTGQTATTRYTGAIGLTQYDPRHYFNPGDVILGSIQIPWIYLHTEEQLLGVSLRALRKVIPGMQRAAVINCPVVRAMTKANTFGLGIASSGTPGSGNFGSGGAVGFTHGSNWSEREMTSVFYIYAMNGGELYFIPPQKPGPPPAPAKAPTTPQPAPAPQPQAQSVVAPALTPQPPAKVLALITKTPIASPCVLKEFVIYFRFDYPEQWEKENEWIDDRYQPDASKVVNYHAESAKMATWLKDHSYCDVVVEGHTDASGSAQYNDPLGERRSQAVYDQLVADGVSKTQIRYSSFGKHEATREHWWKDRKVVLHVEGASSDPDAPINPAR